MPAAKLSIVNFSTDFDREYTSIRKLIIFNNPSLPVTVTVDNVDFEITNSKTFECFGDCFNVKISAKNVESVTLEIWK